MTLYQLASSAQFRFDGYMQSSFSHVERNDQNSSEGEFCLSLPEDFSQFSSASHKLIQRSVSSEFQHSFRLLLLLLLTPPPLQSHSFLW